MSSSLTRQEINHLFDVTDGQIDAWANDIEQGKLPGKPTGPVQVGRPAIYGHALRSVTYRDDGDVVSAMDKRARSFGLTRSQYLRKLVRDDLKLADTPV